MGRGKKRRYEKGSNLVLPGPRITAQVKRRRARMAWFTLMVIVTALAWLGYRELSSSMNVIEFSGP